MINLDLYKNKKGVVADLTILIIMGFLVSIFLVISFIVFSRIDESLSNNPSITAEQEAILGNYVDDYVAIWDTSFFIMFFGVALAGMIFLFLSDTSSMFYFFTWFASMAVLITSAFMANAYGRFNLDPTIAPFANQFIFIPFILSHYLEIMIVINALYIIAFFTKGRGIS